MKETDFGEKLETSTFIVDKIKLRLMALGIVCSERAFSRDMLGKGSTYYSSKKSANADISISALSSLYHNLRKLRDSRTINNRKMTETYERQLDDLADAAAEAIRIKASKRCEYGQLFYVE